MKFSINAYKFLLGMDNTYRLCKDGSWVERQDFVVLDESLDMTFDTYLDAQSWIETTGDVIINGEKANTIPKQESNLFDRDYSFEIVAHRFSKPKNPIPTREQLKDVLINGNDNYTNSLVIDYEGVMGLVQTRNRTPLAIKEYPVRFEAFQAGNEYVGTYDLSHLENTYMAILEGWASHITTGRSFYVDMVSDEQTEQEMIDEITDVISNLK